MSLAYSTSATRLSKRAFDEIRQVKITHNFTQNPAGSCLIEFGQTKVLCTASIEMSVPRWIKAQRLEHGWVTAEYAMLPSATNTRNRRESVLGKVSGRTQEISRLVGRALRTVVNLDVLKGITISIDCDVLQADGGTRTAAITGAWIALSDAVEYAKEKDILKKDAKVIKTQVSAVSAGIIAGKAMLDLDYSEDSKADTDLNVAMTADGKFIEIQGTGEKHPFSKGELNELLTLSEKGCKQLHALQLSE